MESRYPNLKKTMQHQGVSCSELAEMLDMNYFALYRRIRGATEWKLSEAIEICRLLNCYDVHFLFLESPYAD